MIQAKFAGHGATSVDVAAAAYTVARWRDMDLTVAAINGAEKLADLVETED